MYLIKMLQSTLQNLIKMLQSTLRQDHNTFSSRNEQTTFLNKKYDPIIKYKHNLLAAFLAIRLIIIYHNITHARMHTHTHTHKLNLKRTPLGQQQFLIKCKQILKEAMLGRIL